MDAALLPAIFFLILLLLCVASLAAFVLLIVAVTSAPAGRAMKEDHHPIIHEGRVHPAPIRHPKPSS